MKVAKILDWWMAASGDAIDPDAQALITAANITDETQITGIDTLFKALKAGNVYTEIGALYLFLGTTADTQKWNAVNPLNTDAAYRLTWAADTVGAHTSSGYLPNGTTQYADTKFIQSLFNSGLNKMGMFMYARNIPASTTVSLGVAKETTTQMLDRNAANPTWFINGKDSAMTALPANGICGLFLQGPATGTQVASAQGFVGFTQIHFKNHFSGPVVSGSSVAISIGARNSDGVRNFFSSSDFGLVGFTKMIFAEGAYTMFKACATWLNSYRAASISLPINVAIFFGDSITQGQVAQNLSVTSVKYTTLTCTALGFHEVNCGLSGTTMQDGLIYSTDYGPSGYERMAKIPVKTSSEAYLFISYGTNDVYGDGTGSAANFKTKYTSFVQHAINQKGWPANKIVLLTIVNLQNAPQSTTVISYNTKISEVASENGCQLIDIYSYLVANGGAANIQADGIHPNDTGLGRMRDCIVANLV